MYAKATNQDMLLDLQRDAIESLHQRIRCLEYDKHLITIMLHAIYYSVLSGIQVRYIELIFNYLYNLHFFNYRNDKKSCIFLIKKCACRISVMFSKINGNK